MPHSTGLDAIKAAFVKGGFEKGIGHTLEVRGEHAEYGSVTLVGHPDERFYNPLGSVHGGYLATMVDGAMALAVQTVIDFGIPYATTDLSVTYIRVLTGEAGPVTATGTVIETTHNRAFANAQITDAAGTLYVTATASFTISANSRQKPDLT